MLLQKIPGFFQTRRDQLMKARPGAAFVFASNPEMIRNGSVYYPYRQNSNFYYLSGFEEPESFLVLVSQGESYKTILFVQKRDPDRELWDGERYGMEGAIRVFGADEAFLITDFETKAPALLADVKEVYYRMGLYPKADERMLHVLETARKLKGRTGKELLTVHDPDEALGEMRHLKSKEEAGFMREAGRISALAHKEVMKAVKPGMNEREIEALLEYHFKSGGCQRTAYGSIVAGGTSATCLHYHQNNAVLQDGDLLLIDAAGEYQYYASDITRTFPVGKSYSPEQAEIYDLVLKAQKSTIAMVKPGVTMTELHKHASLVMAEGLAKLGITKEKPEELVESGNIREFYPHGTGHWIGIDVHDVGRYVVNDRPVKLKPGMTFTVEPGLYFQLKDQSYLQKYRGIGIRIEDDILVTETGCEVLTSGVPKEREEIEALRQS